MKKLRSILSTLGVIGLVSGPFTAYGQEWVEMSAKPPFQEIRQVSNEIPQFPQPFPPQSPPQAKPAPQQQTMQVAQAMPYYPAPGYAAETSYSELAGRIESLERELAKKSDKPDPAKGFTAPKIGGRVFFDNVSVLNQNNDGINNHHARNFYGVREARLGMTGEGYGFLDYKLEFGFEDCIENPSNGTVNFKDVFIGIKHVPLLGYVRVGNQWVEDGGSELCTGTTNYTFMETPAPVGDFYSLRRLGITSRHLFAKDRGRLYLGAFGAQDIGRVCQRVDSNIGITLSARLTYAPVFQKEGKRMFLYGGYYNFTDPTDAHTVRYARVRPGGWNLGMEDYASVLTDNVHKLGFETAYQNGAFCLQTDVFLRHFSGAGATSEDATMYGGFVMGRYFLTRGDYRRYSLDNACWSGVVVNCPFLLVKRGSTSFMQGPGAWEVAAYYGFLNTDDFDSVRVGANVVPHGTEHQIGAALNWYWNPQLKWALNYIHQTMDLNSGKPNVDAVGLSCRFHW